MNTKTNKLSVKIIVLVVSLAMALTACGNTNYNMSKTCEGCTAQQVADVARCLSNAGNDFSKAPSCVLP